MKALFTKIGELQHADAFTQTVGVYREGKILVAGKQYVHSVSTDYTKFGVYFAL